MLLWLLHGIIPRWRRCCKVKLCVGGTRELHCCEESKDHYYRGIERIIVATWGAWKHCLGVECYYGRSWAIRGMEWGYGRSVVRGQVLHLLHLFFSFLTQLQNFLFFFIFQSCRRRKGWWTPVHHRIFSL